MQPIAFVDVETTGYSAKLHRIIEIGIVTMREGSVVERFSTLINPQEDIPENITWITGIRNEHVTNSPTFDQIQDTIAHLLQDSLFIAHNVQFDYQFVQEEFKRINKEYESSVVCTVKLSRYFYPQYQRHSLEELIHRFNFDYTKRHRAGDDAYVLAQFLQHLYQSFPQERVDQAIARLTQRPGELVGDTYLATKTLLEQHKSINDIAYERKLVRSTIIRHISKLKKADTTLDISYLKPSDALLNTIAQAKRTTHTLGAIKAILGDEYSYDDITLALLFLKDR